MADPELSPMLEDPADGLTDIEPDGEPGPWVIADFDSPCSRECQGITAGEEIRADGTGEWECRDCYDMDLESLQDSDGEPPGWPDNAAGFGFQS